MSDFHPQPHTCHPAVAKMRELHSKKIKKSLNDATIWLSCASWYEALHVACQGEFRPVCPQCGRSQEPCENPLILSLKAKYPKETQSWSSWHKGFLVCEECSNA